MRASSSAFSTRVTCRACDQGPLDPVLSLGTTPLANSLLTDADLEKQELVVPLDLAFCRTCGLVQITETVSPEMLFSDYVYFSSFSDTMVSHAKALSRRLVDERALDSRSLVIEAASNDGYLLKHYQAAGIPVLGIEPARNVATVAIQAGVPTQVDFFSSTVASQLSNSGDRADVFHAHNVLAHVSDLNGFVEGIRIVLKPGGLAVIEAPYVGDMIDNFEFDTIYHEHLCYFSLSALRRLFATHGLTIYDAERVDIHGGTLRVFASPAESAPSLQPGARAILDNESDRQMATVGYYKGFGARVEQLRTALRTLLFDLKRQGRSIAAYGAAAKGSTLLNYVGIGRDVLDFVVDRSPFKQGRYMPGIHLPILAPAELLVRRPEYLLLLAWNFQDEILLQQAEYRRLGGQFIIPVPEPRIV